MFVVENEVAKMIRHFICTVGKKPEFKTNDEQGFRTKTF